MSDELDTRRGAAVSGRSDGRRLGQLVSRWVGIALVLLAVVATLWLAATGRLELYVHPRYTVFTVVFAIVGGVLAVAGLATGLRGGHGDEDPPGDPGDPDAARRRPRIAALLTAGRIAIVAVAAVALLVLPPATLSASTAQSRSIGSSSTALDTAGAPKLVGGSTAGFTVKDWASLLRSGGAEAVTGRTVHVTGYLLPVGSSTDTVYVARLLVTCCAVDAQPVGIPIHLEHWRSAHRPGTWVEVTGRFQENPDAADPTPTVVVPDSVEQIREPAKPYVY